MLSCQQIAWPVVEHANESAELTNTRLISEATWDIPLLDAQMQAREMVAPITKWGHIGRGKEMPGTYHFYTDDYKFSALWNKPAQPLASGCTQVVEANYSTNPEMPRAVALWRTYQKRYLARFWQLHGLRVLVDLNVEPEFADINLLGVPQGWRAYATRWLDQYGEFPVLEQYRLAQERAGSNDVLFVVFGGRDLAERTCARNGWTWIREHSGIVNG